MYRAYVFARPTADNDLRYTETRHADLASALARLRAHKNAVLVTEYATLRTRGCTRKQVAKFCAMADESRG